ncbi:MAG: restriction endonuclease subunit S [Actinomycetota bacterium]|nr:restriction endonuclease subunit S [Actinomycetota bacterium]
MTTARLSDLISDARSGFASGKSDPTGIFQIRMNNVTRAGRWDLSKRRYVPLDEKSLDRFSLAAGDVLFNATNSPDLVGKTALVDQLDEPTVFSNHFLRLRADTTRLNPQYLARWLQLQFKRGTFSAICQRWVNQAAVPRDRLLALTVPLPPLDEQRRVARILDATDALRAMRRAAMSQAQELKEAMFVSTFGEHRQSPITVGERLEKHPRGWRWELLTDVAQLATGHTPDRGRAEYWNGGIPWITLTDIRGLDGKTALQTSETLSHEGIRRSSAVLLPPETVCLSRTASVGFVTMAARELTTSQDFVNWICGATLDPTYLLHAFRRSRDRLRALSNGSTHKTIYFATVERFRVLVPPVRLQREFARQVESLARVESRQQAHLLEVDALFDALQSRAFAAERRAAGD